MYLYVCLLVPRKNLQYLFVRPAKKKIVCSCCLYFHQGKNIYSFVLQLQRKRLIVCLFMLFEVIVELNKFVKEKYSPQCYGKTFTSGNSLTVVSAQPVDALFNEVVDFFKLPMRHTVICEEPIISSTICFN